MGRDSKIEWTKHTFNPWIGCTKVSEGCKHCYAEALMDTRYRKVQWGPQGERKRTSAANWKQPLKWNRDAAAAGVRERVFCASLADWLDDAAPLDWLVDLMDLIEATRNLDWLLLSKRIEHWEVRLVEALVCARERGSGCAWMIHLWLNGIPPKNVWMGASVENQAAADERIPALLGCPAVVRFLSCEPLLGAVSLDRYFGLEPGHEWRACCCDQIDPADVPCVVCESRREYGEKSGLHWVICGGESGAKARPMHPDWARGLRDQCVSAGVPFFFKQWGEWLLTYDRDVDDPDWDRCPRTEGDRGRYLNLAGGFGFHGDRVVFMSRVGKKAAGRMLDGRTWAEMPVVVWAVDEHGQARTGTDGEGWNNGHE